MATNMSIENSKISRNRLPFHLYTEATKENGFEILNPGALLSKYATDFTLSKSANEWESRDPRLISTSHNGQILNLDRPPIDGSIPLDLISSDKSLDNYGKSYRTYSDINTGHITYYLDKSFKDPLYLRKSFSHGLFYTDPMGTSKPQHERYNLDQYDPINDDRSNKGLSWIEDSQEHREDLMSRQMIKPNGQMWKYRWG